MNRVSRKRLAEMKSGASTFRGTIKIDVNAIRERETGMSKKVADALFGPKKGELKGSDVRRAAKNRAWKQFSMFIRLRDSDSYGRAQCITCQRSGHWRTMDAGHYITRAKESTLFDEINVHAQCKGCNRFQGGKFFEHEQAIVRKYGREALDKLKAKAGQECRRTLFDYHAIEKNYAERVAWIKSHDPGKFA